MTKLHIKSEVAYNTIRRIFRDPYVEITTTTLGRLAEALEVPTSELIEDAPDAQVNSTQTSENPLNKITTHNLHNLHENT